MHEFRGERTMGHAFESYDSKIKIKWKRIVKKKMHFSGLLFFLSILEAGASAFILALTAVQLRSKIHNIDIPMYTLFTKF